LGKVVAVPVNVVDVVDSDNVVDVVDSPAVVDVVDAVVDVVAAVVVVVDVGGGIGAPPGMSFSKGPFTWLA